MVYIVVVGILGTAVYARMTGEGGDGHDAYLGHTLYGMAPKNFIANQATLWSPYGPAESYDRVLGPVSGGKMLKTMYTYDTKGRVIKTERQTHLDGMETEQLTYSFTDEVLSRTLIHANAAGQSQLEQYTYTYDHWGRPLQTKHRMGAGSEVTLHDNVYDGVGRLASDGRSAGTYALHTTYSNNVRSWLTGITCTGTGGSLFQEALYYESPVSEGTPHWAGNISQLAWCSGSESTMKRYSFSYDGFGRLLSAAYNGGAIGGNYSTSYAYDANSNLTSIARAAVTGLSGGLVLPRTGTSYLLDGNQVQARLQGGGLRLNGGLRPSLELRQVYYDACGRMVCDSDRGINKIEYNALYLPSTIEYATDGNSLTGYSYGVQYAADGRKLRTGRLAQAKKRLQNATVTDYPEEEELPSAELESLTPGGGRIPVLQFESPTDYVGNLVYKDGVLEKILIDGGFITASDGRYHFFVTDHLGNVRVVVNDAGVIEQVNQFYPYGESIELDPASANPGLETITENPYKWSGKEWDEEQNAYDFGARMYSASDARWTTMDPLCEKYYSISPYAYCAGNPVNLVDPDGMQWYSYEDEDGNLRYTYYEGEMPEEEQKKYKNITSLGLTYEDGTYYYTLFGQKVRLEYEETYQLYSAIDEAIINFYTRTGKKTEMHIDGLKLGEYRGKMLYGGKTFETVSTYGKTGEEYMEDGDVFRNVRQRNSYGEISKSPERSTLLHSHQSNYKGHWLCISRGNFTILQLKFTPENADAFVKSVRNIFGRGNKQ